MGMKKFSLATLALILFMGQVQAQSDVSRARWQSQPVVVDGNDQEWDKPLNFYDDKSGLLYAISNSPDQLYLIFTVRDMMKMHKVMAAGWNVELTSKNKKHKLKASLLFPAVEMQRTGDRKDRRSLEPLGKENPIIKSYEQQLSSVEIKGFRTDLDHVALHKQNGIDIAVGENSDRQLVYEIGIPMNELFGSGGIPAGQIFTLNVSVNALKRPSGSNVDGGRSGRGSFRPSGGMRGGGGGMPRAGGMGSGGSRMGGGPGHYSGESSGNRSSIFQQVSFKQKFRLAENQ